MNTHTQAREPQRLGYVPCACPTCFEIAIAGDGDGPHLCCGCKEAGCDGESECELGAGEDEMSEPLAAGMDTDSSHERTKTMTTEKTLRHYAPDTVLTPALLERLESEVTTETFMGQQREIAAMLCCHDRDRRTVSITRKDGSKSQRTYETRDAAYAAYNALKDHSSGQVSAIAIFWGV